MASGKEMVVHLMGPANPVCVVAAQLVNAVDIAVDKSIEDSRGVGCVWGQVQV